MVDPDPGMDLADYPDLAAVQAKIDAAAVSERMTVLMVVPSLIFGLVFLIPPLLRLLSS